MSESFVYPGQLAFSIQPVRIKTILGSCVSVVFWDTKTCIGGLCHYLLPEPTTGALPSPRYGSFAIPDLLKKMLEAGAHREHIKAKVFGGGNVVNHLNRLDGNIGDRNVEEARSQLKQLNIPIIEENTGGTKGRWIALDTSDFTVEHRFTESKSSENPTLSGVTLTRIRDRIRVLIVDDSANFRNLFAKALAQSPQIEVVGTATDPYDAREKIIALRPDVITLDIEMPRMSGVEFLEKLMTYHPLPVIMVSSQGADGEAAQKSLELGAVEFVQKPSQYDSSLLADLAETLAQKIIAASTATFSGSKPILNRASSGLPCMGPLPLHSLNLIAIGGNVGSSEPLAALIKGLASDSPPVVVSVSTISSFIGTFTQRLQQQCRVELQILRQDETVLSKGRVYFATADSHVLVRKSESGSLVAKLDKGGPFFGQRPSSEKLFLSAAETLPGSVCGIMLSSFSADGIAGLLKIRETGGVTIVQSPEETAFNATPVAAIEKGAADYILNALDIPTCILQLRNRQVLQAM